MDYEVSGKGTTVIILKGINLNTVYPMVAGAGAPNSGTATVVEDPERETGHVLYNRSGFRITSRNLQLSS